LSRFPSTSHDHALPTARRGRGQGQASRGHPRRSNVPGRARAVDRRQVSQAGSCPRRCGTLESFRGRGPRGYAPARRRTLRPESRCPSPPTCGEVTGQTSPSPRPFFTDLGVDTTRSGGVRVKVCGRPDLVVAGAEILVGRPPFPVVSASRSPGGREGGTRAAPEPESCLGGQARRPRPVHVLRRPGSHRSGAFGSRRRPGQRAGAGAGPRLTPRAGAGHMLMVACGPADVLTRVGTLAAGSRV
jgi:hypothetical protein